MLFTLLVTGFILIVFWVLYRAFGSNRKNAVGRLIQKHFPASNTKLDAIFRRLRNQSNLLDKVPKVFTQPHLLPDHFSSSSEAPSKVVARDQSGTDGPSSHYKSSAQALRSTQIDSSQIADQPDSDTQPVIAEVNARSNNPEHAKPQMQKKSAYQQPAQKTAHETTTVQSSVDNSATGTASKKLDDTHDQLPASHEGETHQQLNEKAIAAMKQSAEMVRLRTEANKAQKLATQVQDLSLQADRAQALSQENKRLIDAAKNTNTNTNTNTGVRSEDQSEKQGKGQRKDPDNKQQLTAAKVPATANPSEQLFTPPSYRDDLKQIKGIGKVMEKTLNQLGVTTFKQLGNFDANDVQRVSNALSVFPGRIERDEWVKQAQHFHEINYGEETTPP